MLRKAIDIKDASFFCFSVWFILDGSTRKEGVVATCLPRLLVHLPVNWQVCRISPSLSSERRYASETGRLKLWSVESVFSEMFIAHLIVLTISSHEEGDFCSLEGPCIRSVHQEWPNHRVRVRNWSLPHVVICSHTGLTVSLLYFCRYVKDVSNAIKMSFNNLTFSCCKTKLINWLMEKALHFYRVT